MKDLGITKGEWKVDNTTVYSLYQTSWDSGKPVMTNRFYLSLYPDYHSSIAKSEVIENAKLIADAGNTANKCGLLPSELLAQRDELLSALEMITKRLKKELDTPYNSFVDKAEKAIKKATS